MLKFESIRIDPTPGEIVETLSEATAAVNKKSRERLVKDDSAKWRKFARAVEKSPEGFELFRGGKGSIPASQVIGAWWTDHIGRKHVVIRARRIEIDAAQCWVDRHQLATRSPLWHCYPEYVCERMVGGSCDWIAVCGCGAMGTPAALGWMGPCCGPCHDRREESGDAALVTNRRGMLTGQWGPITAIAFSHDEERIAAAEPNGAINVWFFTGEPVVRRAKWVMDYVRRIGFVGDGRSHVLGVGWTNYAANSIALSLQNDPPQVSRDLILNSRQHDLLFTRHPDQIILCEAYSPRILFRWPARMVEHSIEIWDPDQNDTDAVGFDNDENGTDLMNSTGEYLITINTQGLNVHDVFRNQHVGRERYSAGILANFNFRRVIADYNPILKRLVYVSDTWCELILIESPKNQTICACKLPFVARHLQFTHDAQFIIMADSEGRVHILNPDTLQMVAGYRWHIDAITCMVISPDGRTLATGGAEGIVKLWPIDRVLQSIS